MYKSKDIEFGLKQEDLVYKRLVDFFKKDLKKTTTYEKWDWIDEDNTTYELKSRRCMSSSYSTTILPIHKLIENKKQVFIFNYLNGIYYINNDDNKFNSYKRTNILDSRCGAEVLHYLIPIQDLLPLQ